MNIVFLRAPIGPLHNGSSSEQNKMAYLFTSVTIAEFSRNLAAGHHWVIRQMKERILVVVLIV